MSEPSKTITPERLPEWAHIPDAEIEQDIRETADEILMRKKLRIDPDGVEKRQMFIAKLRRILELRQQVSEVSP